MRTRLIFFIVAVLSLTISPTSLTSNAASSKLEILAITDTKPGEVEVTFNSKIAKSLITSYQITAKPKTANGESFSKSYKSKVSGLVSHKISKLTPKVEYIFTIRLTTKSKQVITSASFNYLISSTTPSAPLITKAVATDADEAVLFFDAPIDDGGSPVYYYTALSNPGGISSLSPQSGPGSITITGLSKSTTYTFTFNAFNINGSSLPSKPSLPVTTLAEKIVRTPTSSTTGPTLAAPAFTLSSISETQTVNTVATGFTISSTGGAIASFGINTTPPGMSFSTSTGALTGTPNTVAPATAYTITATNAAGSAVRTFTLTVTAVVYTVGQTGPGGGKIFYVATTPFVCGPTRATTCTYLEAAPPALGLASFDSDTVRTTARTLAQLLPVNYQSTAVNNASSPETATATAIGWGYRNTRAIILQGNTDTATSAAALADSHTVTVSGVVYDDWYLPSKDELNQMCKWVRGVAWTSDATVCTGGTINTGLGAAGFVGGAYWSSSEGSALGAWDQYFGNGLQFNVSKTNTSYVRPIRAF
jgi:hypothetical protein